MNQNKTYNDTVKILALCRTGGVGPRLFDALFHRYRSLDNILAANVVSLLTMEGMTKPVADKIVKAAKKLDEAAKYVADLKAREIETTTRFDPGYPNLLFELNDPPPLLYVKGKFPDPAQKSVALVGTSNPSNAGIEMTTRLAREFAGHGVQVVSTFRGGIDTAAHLGAKAAEGQSFAVIDSGFDKIVESEFKNVAVDIALTGGVISEYAPDLDRPITALEETNRLLVGLAQGVVVTEFYHTSRQTLDLLNFCQMIGKLAFIVVDPDKGAFADEESLTKALEYGVIPLEGYDKVHDIIRSLV